MLTKTLRFAVSGPLLTGAASAAVLVQYTMPVGNYANGTGAAYAPTTQSGSLTSATNILANSTVALRSKNGPDPTVDVPTPNPTYSSFVLKVAPVNGSNAPATAVSLGSYAYFTVTGPDLDLTSLSFDAARGGGTVRGVVVRSSVDNFTTDLLIANIPTAQPTLTAYGLDLTGSNYQNLTSVTFRIYAYTADANGTTVDIDNITLNGTVIPEPSTLAIALLGGASLFARRRKR